MTIDSAGAKILLVDDNPANIDILIELLEEYDVRAVLDGESALDTVQEEVPDLVLLDITMPGMDGFEVCRRLKDSSRTKEVPVIFLSASNDDASVLKGFEVGGVDYITKPYRAKEVLARVKTHIQLFIAMQQLEKIATTDELTGISNRRKFFMRSVKLIEQAKNKRIPLYLAVIDMDGFKPINDNYGHDIGDAAIKAVVDATKELMPPKICFARLGGDEFTLMLTGTEEKVLKQLDLLRKKVETMRIPGSGVHVSLSIGVTRLSEDTDTIHSLLKRADKALYHAKKAGGNKVAAHLKSS